jgi:5-methylcytosine-specific restriction endonuclease McrA
MTRKLSTTKENNFSEHDIKFLFNELRKSSIIWSGRKEVLQSCRRKVFIRRAKNGNAVYKYEWQCAKCSKWTRNEKEMEVDHIVEIGGVSEFNGDWNETIKKIFPRPVLEHLQALCISCHLKKTRLYASARTKYIRKKPIS